MGHKPQIVFDELVAGREVALCPEVDVGFLLLGAQGPGEGAQIASEPQRQNGTAHEEEGQRGEYHIATTISEANICFVPPRKGVGGPFTTVFRAYLSCAFREELFSDLGRL